MTTTAKFPRVLAPVVVWTAMTMAAILLQWGAGAFGSDFGGHPDEGAHFVTGLMVRDYFVSGIPEHPMRYAENYYAHYPKVALGHYPPGFYVLEGAWLAVFPVSRASVLVFMAVLSGAFGTLVFVGSRIGKASLPVALGAAGLTVSLPLTQNLASTVMSDFLVAILAVLSAWSFVRYMDEERWIYSLGFGCLATAATMTKGSGLFLALVPPMAILLTGRYRLLAKASLWIAPIPVVLVCGPWLYFSSKITAEGMVDRGILEHLQLAVPYFATQFFRVFGMVVLLAAVAGAGWVVFRRSVQREPFWVMVLSLPVCLVVFYTLIPAGLEARYLLPAVPSIFLLAVAGIRWGVSLVPDRRRSTAAWVIGVAATALFLAETFTVPDKNFIGYRAAVRDLAARAGREGQALKFLVSSDARGEGAFVSEVAILDDRRPRHTVERSSKVLAQSDWLGRGYGESFESDEQLRSFLREARYDGILVDEGIPEIFRRPHHQRIARVLASSDAFTRVPDLSGPPGSPSRRGGRSAVYVRVPAIP